jgi:DNA replication licensing factor MCM7
LTGFKTSPEQTITTALGNITIGEDDLDEEDDLMDDDGQGGNRRQQAKERRAPQYKYKNMLQQLSDRTIDEATIDLDDLATV